MLEYYIRCYKKEYFKVAKVVVKSVSKDCGLGIKYYAKNVKFSYTEMLGIIV
jgi:hypothetical protein